MKSLLDLSRRLEKQPLPNGESANVYVTSDRGYISTIEDAFGNVLKFQHFPRPEGYMGGDAQGAWLWCDVQGIEREEFWSKG